MPRTAPPGPAFHLHGVGVALGGAPVLQGIDLKVEGGEAVALVGPSGAGKTTLLRVLAGSLRPSRGRVEALGRPLEGMKRRELRETRSRIGFIHQDLALVPMLRVCHNVLSGRLGRQGLAESLWRMTFPTRPDLAEVHRLLERVGIGDKLFQRTDTLSGGQRQRVAVARALYQDPGALLADEPVSSVDPERARRTVALLCELSRERGLTLLVSLHDLDLAREFFPRLVGVSRGAIAFDLPTPAVGTAQLQALFDLTAQESVDPRRAER